MEADFAAALLRLAFGGMILAHGWNKVWGAGGISGTASWFEALGFSPARLHAWIAAGTEMGAGVTLILGFGGPLGCAAVVGLMVVASLTDHRGKGFFVFKGGWEYTATTAIAATALAVLGFGKWSLDGVIGIDVATQWRIGSCAFGAMSALAVLVVGRRPAPSASMKGLLDA